MTPEALRDELGRPCNPLVLRWGLERAAARGLSVVFPWLERSVDGDARLIVESSDGARDEISLRAGWTPDDLRRAMGAVQQRRGVRLAAFPHGELVGLWRDEPSTDAIELLPQAYRPVLDLSGQAPAEAPAERAALTPHLRRLEAESLHILREAVAEADNPVMLHSLGKDSSVMLHLARKAFHPSRPPFPLLHVDTRWKFQEMLLFRDFIARETGMRMIVHVNPEAVRRDINPFDHGSALHTDVTKTEGLKQALEQHRFDLAFGGARRDEERSRAKERVFSLRSATHRWDPKAQRPELWNLYNTRKGPGETLRVFPLSNWTELDVWQYVLLERIPVVPLYFARPRAVVVRPDMIMVVDDERCRVGPDECIEIREVRFRTLGCYPLTGAVESGARTLEQIVLELVGARRSEREGRRIDTDGAGSMERKKQEGYF